MPPRNVKNSMDARSSLRISWKCRHRRLLQLAICLQERIRQTRNQSSSPKPQHRAWHKTTSSLKIDRPLNSRLWLSSSSISSSPHLILIWIIERQLQLEAHKLLRPVPLTNNRLLSGVATSQTLSTYRAVYSTRNQRFSSRNRPLFSKKCSVRGRWVTR